MTSRVQVSLAREDNEAMSAAEMLAALIQAAAHLAADAAAKEIAASTLAPVALVEAHVQKHVFATAVAIFAALKAAKVPDVEASFAGAETVETVVTKAMRDEAGRIEAMVSRKTVREEVACST